MMPIAKMVMKVKYMTKMTTAFVQYVRIKCESLFRANECLFIRIAHVIYVGVAHFITSE